MSSGDSTIGSVNMPRGRSAAPQLELFATPGQESRSETRSETKSEDWAAPVPEPDTHAEPRLQVELRRGSRRRRHVEGVLQGERLVVSYPQRMSEEAAALVAEELRARMQRRVARDRVDLDARARRLAREYALPQPKSVEWSERQLGRWGSCTPADGSIRVSARLAQYPLWVLDYVLVHELAHLRWADHGSDFQAAVARFAKAERAKGFLIAKDLDPDSR
jgi:hypothetical protein